MFAKDSHSTDTGCLIVLLERGEPAGPGAIGAVRPSRWLCSFWTMGTIWQRELLCDLVFRAPTPAEMASDMADHPDSWTRRPMPAAIQPGA
jgi:hypothetical protein